MPAPPSGELPSLMVTPEIVTVTPDLIEKIGTAPFPLITRFEAPGPLMARLVPIVSVLLMVIVAGKLKLKLIVSPEAAVSIAFRSDPKPLSFALVTAIALAKLGE